MRKAPRDSAHKAESPTPFRLIIPVSPVDESRGIARPIIGIRRTDRARGSPDGLQRLRRRRDSSRPFEFGDPRPRNRRIGRIPDERYSRFQIRVMGVCLPLIGRVLSSPYRRDPFSTDRPAYYIAPSSFPMPIICYWVRKPSKTDHRYRNLDWLVLLAL